MGAVTPRELRQLAKQGNTGAMMSLGFFYFDGQAGNVDLNEALAWYEMAAQRDLPAGMYMAANCHKLLAIQPGAFPGKEREAHWKAADQWYTMLLRCFQEGWSGTEKIEVEAVRKGREDARYHLAVYAQRGDQSDEALRYLYGMNDTRSQFLRANIAFEKYPERQWPPELVHAFEKIAADQTYASAEKSTLERLTYVVFVTNWSMILLHGGSSPDGKLHYRDALQVLLEAKRADPAVGSWSYVDDRIQRLQASMEAERSASREKYMSAFTWRTMAAVIFGALALFFPLCWILTIVCAALAIHSYCVWKQKEAEFE